MKTIDDIAAQGELLIQLPIAGGEPRLPASAKPVPPTGGVHVWGHSETGHHHTVDGKLGTFYQDASDPNKFYFVPATAAPVPLKHQRLDHQHEEVVIEAGGNLITIRRQVNPWTKQAMPD